MPRPRIEVDPTVGLPLPAMRLEHTRRAWGMLPRLTHPRILDLGCGDGVPTVELARVSGGTVVGLDIDGSALERLMDRAAAAGLGDRITTLEGSVADLPFPDGSFDVVWGEGIAHVVGFERALAGWGRVLVPDGFMVLHVATWLRPDPPEGARRTWGSFSEDVSTLEGYADRAAAMGCEVIGSFDLPESAWWDLYYGPLGDRIASLLGSQPDDTDVRGELEAKRQEVEHFRRYRDWLGSGFIAMRRP